MAYDNNEQQPELPESTVSLLRSLQDYRSTVPDELTRYYVTRAGCSGEPDAAVTRLLSVACERFIATVVQDAVQIAKRRLQLNVQQARRQQGGAAGKEKDKQRVALTAEDLTEALKEYGVTACAPPYFVNHANK